MERQLIGKVAITGDKHWNSKGYGSHRDYPSESLLYEEKLTEILEEEEITHLIGLGDIAYSSFTDLGYRDAIDGLLERQFKLTNGNRWEVKGNHDASSKGMTEYEYYKKKGLIKPSENIKIGMLNITMVDYKKELEVEPLISNEEGQFNVICAHNYFKFESSELPNFGEPRVLDNFEKWYGANYILLGHIHHRLQFKGSIVKDNLAKEAVVDYLGCAMRPAYREGMMDDKGYVIILEVYSDGTINRIERTFDLLTIAESFNLEKMEEEEKHHDLVHVDISEVVDGLNNHERAIGNPEDIISAMTNIDIRYKDKAIKLLMEAGK